MSSLDLPLNAAHQHAANADEYVMQGLWISAAEEHYKAAEAFSQCIDASSEENTKRTLRRLHNEHTKAGKELQRKIQKLKEEGKDPSLPQKPKPASSSKSKPDVSPTSPMTPSQAAASPNSGLSDSQQMVEESFMLLGQRSEGNDAFNHFWRITEGMLDYLSQPVAFATAPLGPPENSIRRREGSSSSDTEIDDPISRGISRGVDFVRAATSRMLTRNDSSNSVGADAGQHGPVTFPSSPGDGWDDDGDSDDDGMADSFFVVPSKSDSSNTNLKKENVLLKANLEEAQKKLAAVEKMLQQRKEHDQQLRDSIMLARKEAQRAMTSSMALRAPGQPPAELAALTVTTPAAPSPVAAAVTPGRDREAQLVRRVRELEEELRTQKLENEKQKAMIVKFRERWEKLKESAKRKKQARAAAETTSVVGDRIEEDPEAEEEAERDDIQRRKQDDATIS